jgi:hypothetical protein
VRWAAAIGTEESGVAGWARAGRFCACGCCAPGPDSGRRGRVLDICSTSKSDAVISHFSLTMKYDQ